MHLSLRTTVVQKMCVKLQHRRVVVAHCELVVASKKPKVNIFDSVNRAQRLQLGTALWIDCQDHALLGL